MRVMFYPVGRPPEVREIDGSLKSMQGLVCGYIEVLDHERFEGLVYVFDEDGKIDRRPANRVIYGGNDYIAGDFFVCRADGPDMVSLTEEDIEKLLREEGPSDTEAKEE